MKLTKLITIAASAVAMLVQLSCSSCTSCSQLPQQVDTVKVEAPFRFGAGVNLDNWLSQSPLRGAARSAYMTRADIDSIAAWGFDHVRIPIEESHMYDEALNRDTAAFNDLARVLTYLAEDGLCAVVDLHSTKSSHYKADPEQSDLLFVDSLEQVRFLKIWADLQNFLINFSTDQVAFELLTELNTGNPEYWNDLLNRTIAQIRKREPLRKVVVGSSSWQLSSALKDLRIPPGDKNIILNFHHYDPIPVTSYRAPWSVFKEYKGAVRYPGDVLVDTSFISQTEDSSKVKMYLNLSGMWTKERMERNIKEAVDCADSLGLQLFCGEFGVFPPYISDEIRMQWYRDVVDIFRRYKICYSHWGYKGDYPVTDLDGSASPLVEILVGKPKEKK